MLTLAGVGFGPYLLDSRRKPIARGREPVGLSPWEYEVLHLLVRRPDVVLPKDALILPGGRTCQHDQGRYIRIAATRTNAVQQTMSVLPPAPFSAQPAKVAMPDMAAMMAMSTAAFFRALRPRRCLSRCGSMLPPR